MLQIPCIIYSQDYSQDYCQNYHSVTLEMILYLMQKHIKIYYYSSFENVEGLLQD